MRTGHTRERTSKEEAYGRRTLRPSISRPLVSSIALSASSGLTKVTKPNPRDMPALSPSRTRFTYVVRIRLERICVIFHSTTPERQQLVSHLGELDFADPREVITQVPVVPLEGDAADKHLPALRAWPFWRRPSTAVVSAASTTTIPAATTIFAAATPSAHRRFIPSTPLSPISPPLTTFPRHQQRRARRPQIFLE
jgi:hypothetical protein